MKYELRLKISLVTENDLYNDIFSSLRTSSTLNFIRNNGIIKKEITKINNIGNVLNIDIISLCDKNNIPYICSIINVESNKNYNKETLFDIILREIGNYLSSPIEFEFFLVKFVIANIKILSIENEMKSEFEGNIVDKNFKYCIVIWDEHGSIILKCNFNYISEIDTNSSNGKLFLQAFNLYRTINENNQIYSIDDLNTILMEYINKKYIPYISKYIVYDSITGNKLLFQES
jgi:hypothetical protein